MKRYLLIFTLLLSSSVVLAQHEGHPGDPIKDPSSLVGEIYINARKGGMAEAGKATQVEIQINAGAEGEQALLNDFEGMHGKFMHLVLVSQDFSSFAHVHPFYDASTGSFHITLNMNSIHPDNQAAATALQKAGHYFVYAEVKSKSVGMKKFSWDLHVHGSSEKESVLPDQMGPDGWIVKYLSEKGEENNSEAFFRLRFRYQHKVGCGGALVQMQALLETRQEDGTYALTQDLEPWMMMGAHVLVLGERGSRAADKNFAHLHGEFSPDGGDFRFGFFDRGQWGPEVIKIWIQTQRKGKVLTLPVAFDYQPFAPHEGDCL